MYLFMSTLPLSTNGGGRGDAPRGGTKASQTVLVVRLPRLTTRMGGDVPGVDLGASQIDV